MPDDDSLLAQGTVDARQAGRDAANRGDGLDAPPAESPDERDRIVALALERFYGGHGEMEENEQP